MYIGLLGHSFSMLQLKLYDDIINKPSNDWDLYYWMTGASVVPVEFQNEVMDLMVEHAKNTRMEVRITQPPLVCFHLFRSICPLLAEL